MKIKTAFLSLVITALLVSGCVGMQKPPTIIQVTQTPAIQVTQSPTQVVPPGNVACNNTSLFLDPALGSGYECQNIAESNGADLPYFDIHPEYTEVSLKNYQLTGTIPTPRIAVFTVQLYSILSPDILPVRVADLQVLISNGKVSFEELPLLPLINAAQMFYVQTAVIEFGNGKGIRYITQYAKGITPINNQELFYTFQGLTADGQYWISVVLPISTPIVPGDGTTPPAGHSMESFTNNYLTYIADATAQLNTQTPASFTPSITMLDALIRSIVVQP
jgi:hypothetical protein